MTSTATLTPSQLLRSIVAGHGPVPLVRGEQVHPLYLTGPSGPDFGCLVAARWQVPFSRQWQTAFGSLWRLNVFTGAAHQVDPVGPGHHVAPPAALAWPPPRLVAEEVLDAHDMAAVLLDELHPVVFTDAGRAVGADYWRWFAAATPLDVRAVCWRFAPDFFTWLLDSTKAHPC